MEDSSDKDFTSFYPLTAKYVFLQNTGSSFMVDLAKSIKLNGQWAVGLCKIIYPHTWYNSSYFELYDTTAGQDQHLVIVKFGRGRELHAMCCNKMSIASDCLDILVVCGTILCYWACA